MKQNENTKYNNKETIYKRNNEKSKSKSNRQSN